MRETTCFLPAWQMFCAQADADGIDSSACWCEWHHLPRPDQAEGDGLNHAILLRQLTLGKCVPGSDSCQAEAGSDGLCIQVKEDEAPLLDIYAQHCAMVNAVIHVARHCAGGMAFAGMLG